MEKLHVICVDDQREVLSAAVQDLSVLGKWLTIEECESADEALEVMDDIDANGDLVAVVVSDHVMPKRTGVELLADISQDSRFLHTKKVLLTGQATHADTITAINQARIESYFEKPWQAELLVEKVRMLASEYIFDKGLDYTLYQGKLDQHVLLHRLR